MRVCPCVRVCARACVRGRVRFILCVFPQSKSSFLHYFLTPFTLQNRHLVIKLNSFRWQTADAKNQTQEQLLSYLWRLRNSKSKVNAADEANVETIMRLLARLRLW